MDEIAVNAATTGHDLTGFEPVVGADDTYSGYQVTCRQCGATTWVAQSGLIYLLGESCPEEIPF
jgi:hypothetical protein